MGLTLFDVVYAFAECLSPRGMSRGMSSGVSRGVSRRVPHTTLPRTPAPTRVEKKDPQDLKTDLQTLFNTALRSKTEFDAMQMDDDVRKNVRLLLEINETKELIALEEKVNQAFDRGISKKCLKSIVGSRLDVEQLSYTRQLDKECGICLDAFTKAQFIGKKIHKTACDHYFHTECIKKWAETKPKPLCPMDNATLSFGEESKTWNRYLYTIHSKIKALHPGVSADDDREEVSEADEVAFALKTVEEELRDKEDSERQFNRDRALAIRIQHGWHVPVEAGGGSRSPSFSLWRFLFS